MSSSRWFALLATVAVTIRLDAQAPPRFDPATYTARSAEIPMRDGVTLHTELLIPSGAASPMPFLFRRTPYGVPDATPQLLTGGNRELAEDGYVFVLQDIRGRYRSGGSGLPAARAQRPTGPTRSLLRRSPAKPRPPPRPTAPGRAPQTADRQSRS